MVNKTTQTIFWSFIEKLSSNGVQFIITLILARLLTPDDYGLIAMIMVFYAFSQALIDSGFASALIQKQDCTQCDFSTVFFFNIFISIVLYLILFFTAPLIANYYHSDLLVNIIRVYCLNLIINALFMVHRTILIKELRFRPQALITLICSIVSGIFAIILAYCHWAYWALVFQIIVSSLLSFALTVSVCKWRPTFEFSLVSFKKLFPFGFNILLTAILNSIYNNLYSLIIGRKFNSTLLGYYNRAYSLSSTVSISIADLSMKALYPIHSSIQNEQEKLNTAFNNSLKILMLFIVPFNLFLMVNAKDILILLIGYKWISATLMFQLLCIVFIFYPMLSLNINMLKVMGRSDYLFRSELIKKIVGVILVSITSQFGINSMIYGLIFYSVFDVLLSSIFVYKISNIKPINQFKCVLFIGLSALLPLFVAKYFTSSIQGMFLRIVISASVMLFLYLIICLCIKLISLNDIKKWINF